MKKVMKTAAWILVAAIAAVTAGCGSAVPNRSDPDSKYIDWEPESKTAVNVTVIAGPTGVGMVDLMQADTDGRSVNDYAFTVVSDPNQAVAAIVNGSADIAAVPTNLAAALYKKTGGKVQVLATNMLGSLYMLTNGETVQSIADLKGKTVYTSGQGANPEYILRHLLKKNGIDPDKDLTITFVEDNDVLQTLVANGTAKVAMVPEPKATACMTLYGDIKAALDMTAEWEKVSENGNSALLMGCVVARSKFVQDHPDAVAAFLTEYEKSIRTVAEDIGVGAKLCADYGVIPKVAIAEQAIPRCHLQFLSGAGMKAQLSGYLQVLFDYDPKAVSGVLPDDGFYYGG